MYVLRTRLHAPTTNTRRLLPTIDRQTTGQSAATNGHRAVQAQRTFQRWLPLFKGCHDMTSMTDKHFIKQCAVRSLLQVYLMSDAVTCTSGLRLIRCTPTVCVTVRQPMMAEVITTRNTDERPASRFPANDISP
jgi:hypothetical protein